MPSCRLEGTQKRCWLRARSTAGELLTPIALLTSQWPFIGSVIVLPLLTAVLSVMMAVIPAVMYEELIALKGGRPDLTSEIFA